MTESVEIFGSHLRSWRKRRRLSQLELALRADVSARHLGFVELGRANASRALVLRLADELEVPLRERNTWLRVAGFAPQFGIGEVNGLPIHIKSAIAATLEAHKPFPAFAIDRHWNVSMSNAAVPELYEGVIPELLEPPVNVMRLTLHPGGLAPRILNLNLWAEHLLARLRHEIDLTADAGLMTLLIEAEQLYSPTRSRLMGSAGEQALALPLQIQTRLGLLSFLSTITVFGTAADVRLSEIALEMLYPADEATRLAVASAPSESWRAPIT